MPLNHYVTLGRSGLRVSPLCLGAMTFGPEVPWSSSVGDAQEILDRFIDRGGNFIDTANIYNFGHSEKIIGDHLGQHSSRRHRIVIGTKFSSNLILNDPNGGGSGRKSILAACEESLRRLRTDYIDLYWLHCWDPHTPVDEVLRALDDLVRSGKVRYIGISNTPAWQVAQAQMISHFRGWTEFVALQIEYSLLERSVESELVPMARALGLGVTPWSPLKGGILSGKYTRENAATEQPLRGDWVRWGLNEQAYKVIDVLTEVARELETTPARVALAWLFSRAGVTSPVIGARTLQQLDDNLGALEVSLSAAQLERLNQITAPPMDYPMRCQQMGPVYVHGNISINGQHPPLLPFIKGDIKPY